MTSSSTPTPDSHSRRPNRQRVWSVLVSFLAGLVATIAALVLIVVIRPLGWRLLTTALLWIPGVTALIVFSDGLDQVLPGRRRRWAAEAVHWLSASFVALALAVVLGAFVPSLFGLSTSPPVFAALGCDALIGILAGLLTVGLTAVSGWAGGELSYRVRRLRWARDGDPERFRLSLRDGWAWRETVRMTVLPVAGVIVSGACMQVFAAVPSETAAPAADTSPELPSVWSSIVLPLAIWFLATGLVWLAFDMLETRKRQIHPQTDSTRLQASPIPKRRRATHASALAVGLAIAVGWISAWVLNDVIQGSLSTRGSVTGVSVESVPSARQAAYLAQQFVPEFELAPGERWEPTTVDWYVAHSKPTASARFCVPGPKIEPQGCRELCNLETGAQCASLCDDSDPGACAPPGGNPHAVYYLYRDAANTPNDHPAQSGHDWAVIEYWIFYNYDSLSAGLITQWHQSDWEQVSVLVERRGSTEYPVEVGFSEHCYGAAVPATEVSWHGSHPVSFVGLGSHANYPTEKDVPIRQLQCLTRQTPRYLGAAGLFFNPNVAGWSLELPIAYLIGLRDQTGQVRTITDAQPIQQQATPSIWSFDGYWGVDNNLRIVTGGVPIGAGPESPQDQNPALKPFRNMFCSSSWLKISPPPTTAWVCLS